MSTIGSLPDELLAGIAEHLHPCSIKSFAQVNRRFLACSQKALELHRDRWSSLRLTHDRQPRNVINLLRQMIENSQLAWYPRRFEFWGVRPEWKKWKSWSFSHGNPLITDNIDYDKDWDRLVHDWPEPFTDDSKLDQNFYPESDLEWYRKIMVDDLHLTEDEVGEWMNKLQEGNDEPIKGILMALCSNLRQVIFIAYDSWQNDEYQDKHPLSFLSTALWRLAALPSYPNIFRNLKCVSVATQTELRHPHDGYYPNGQDVAALFTLPAIETLELNLIGYHDDESNGEFTWPYGDRFSTVQNLRFYCCSLIFRDMLLFLNAPKALRSFQCRAGCPKPDAVIEVLAQNFATSLEVLKPDSRIQLKQLASFKVLKSVSIDFCELMDPPLDRSTMKHDFKTGSYDIARPGNWNCRWVDMAKRLPPDIEEIVLIGSQLSLRADETPGFVEMLKQVVLAKPGPANMRRRDDNFQLPNLKMLCVWEVNTHHKARVFEIEKGAWRETGEKEGVDQFCNEIRQLCRERHIEWHTREEQFWSHRGKHWTGEERNLETEPKTCL